MSSSVQDIYSFFEFFKKYKSYESAMEKKYLEGTHDTSCDSYLSDFQNLGTERANDICVKFKILYNLIISTKTSPKSKSLDDIDFAYLNYWLNGKLKNNSTIHNLTVEKFQKNMSHIEEEFVHDNFDGKLYDLGEDDYKNMNLINELQTNHGEIFQNTSGIKENVACIGYFNKFINTYKKGIVKCPHDNTSFCNVLKHFKKEYEDNFFGKFGITEKCSDKEFLKLPTYNDISLEDKKITIFTSLGQWIRTKIGSTKEAQNNLYDENNQLFLDTSDNRHINFDEISYRLSYDSALIS
ncbi:PIR protein [Plasmodium ovale]|uniref:PIR protein n=1 Tax=Plasmodium ovale TaxID=36330 RepID=A0A1D3JF61_PLAOA|nr:PIR protein [Plasmodium ovale]